MTAVAQRVRTRNRTRLRGFLLALPPVLVIAFFIGLPVIAAIAYTFGYSGGINSVVAALAQKQHLVDGAAPTFDAYREVLGDSSFRTDLLVTVIVTIVTVVLVMVLSWAIALYARFSRGVLAKLVTALAVVPMFIPVVIASYAILTFYSTDGFTRTLFHLLGWEDSPALAYKMTGVTVGQVWTHLPFGVLLISSGLSSVPDTLIDAARDAGASMSRAVRAVMIPMAALPTIIVATFTGIGVLGSFTVPYLIGPNAPNMLGVSMAQYYQSFNQAQQAVVMAVVVFVLAAGIGYFYVRANAKSARGSGRL
ncbi:ABC transporter permease subunit [Nonomuraea phyllanthi]|uniref:ABC transporter permease subunit n=1 Tax=Nonomuraea phyllanthi TaxID=2219224 RepID=A0A5C4WS09_9ACTN|nr:ABC transporter permease subunit [Nonomuraea phyllanthi]KAB8195780.1 ABC transporter permease subunit [Nonomuraea phyllanthi]QFY07235.1 ABC transporter permease subunit [Nonomuraea phyllanthi]